jgi:hypothetical protein
MHIFNPLCEILSDLPGVNPTTNDGVILYCGLLAKVDWFRRLLTVNFRQPSYEFTFNVGIDLLF